MYLFITPFLTCVLKIVTKSRRHGAIFPKLQFREAVIPTITVDFCEHLSIILHHKLFVPMTTHFWEYPRWDLNPHDYKSTDFKSAASANSATGVKLSALHSQDRQKRKVIKISSNSLPLFYHTTYDKRVKSFLLFISKRSY